MTFPRDGGTGRKPREYDERERAVMAVLIIAFALVVSTGMGALALVRWAYGSSTALHMFAKPF